MFRAVTVSIVHPDPTHAGADAAQELLDELGHAPDVVIAFVSAALDTRAVLAGFYEVMPPAVRLIGCTSYAEINSEEALTHSVTLMGVCLGTIEARFVRAEPGPGHAPGEALAAELAGFDAQLLLVFPDILTVNLDRCLRTLQDRLGRHTPIIGGAPSDMGAFTATHQFIDGSLFTGGIVALALKGPLRIVTAAHSGYSMFGSERTVTKSDGVKLLELDGQSARSMYLGALGPRGSDPDAMVEHPLGIVGYRDKARTPGDAALLIRAVFGLDEASGALQLGCEVEPGTTIRMTRGSRDSLVAAASEASRQVTAQSPRPALAFIFDCISRKAVLGSRYKEEIKAVYAALPDGVPRIGFYTFGELSPVDGVTQHHESTFTLAFLVVDA